MTATVITVFNEKGGCGKTTIAMHLGGVLAMRGHKTMIADCDPQGTATNWARGAPDDSPFPATVISLAKMGGKVHREIHKLIEDYDFIVVDCPPSVEAPHSSSALLISNLAVMPSIPSPLDLWAVQAAKGLVQAAQVNNENLKAFVVANAGLMTAKLNKFVLDQLREDEDIPLLKSKIGTRTPFRMSGALGCMVHSVPNSATAVREIEAFVDEVLSKL